MISIQHKSLHILYLYLQYKLAVVKSLHYQSQPTLKKKSSVGMLTFLTAGADMRIGFLRTVALARVKHRTRVMFRTGLQYR